jgi:hypothetical protein
MTVTISGAKYHVTTEADLFRLLFALATLDALVRGNAA